MTSDNRAANMWEEMEALLRERENDAGEGERQAHLLSTGNSMKEAKDRGKQFQKRGRRLKSKRHRTGVPR